MNVGILGTGMAGRALAGAIAGAGNRVAMGTRDVSASLGRRGDDGLGTWQQAHPDVEVTPFAAAAEQGDIVFNATAGAISVAVLQEIGQATLAGKVLVDLANPLDFSQGFPPSLTVANTHSLAEQIQSALPDTAVVKALNTVNASVMVNPTALGAGDHDLPLCGNDDAAKATVAGLLRGWFGWQSILDLGDLSAARGMEAYLLLWVRLMGTLGTPTFNLKMVR